MKVGGKKQIHFTVKPKVHFMGIGGSGISGVAQVAKSVGYQVCGCDLEKDTAYSKRLREANIDFSHGHSKRHLKNVDILVTTPAVVFQNAKHPEFQTAKDMGLVMTWQEFVGNYLLKGKRVIAIAGTHGKSTTAAMAALLFKQAGLDPSAIIGANVNKWGSNFRVGKGIDFFIEADEFFDNFLNYQPEITVLNNIEFDHPDFFKSEVQLYQSYQKFIKGLTGQKILIVNQDSPGIKKLLQKLNKSFLDTISLVGYSLSDKPLFETRQWLRAEIVTKVKSFTTFRVKSSKKLGVNTTFKLAIAGIHNVANCLGVIALARQAPFRIEVDKINKFLKSYSGIGRRMELVGRAGRIKVYDDYAHHPTEIGATLQALRQAHQENRIWAIVEPHSYSRTKALLADYKTVFTDADKVVIGPIFKARDLKTFGISGNAIVRVTYHKDIHYFNDLEKIKNVLRKTVKSGDVIIVMGAGKSYQWAKEIAKIVSKKIDEG